MGCGPARSQTDHYLAARLSCTMYPSKQTRFRPVAGGRGNRMVVEKQENLLAYTLALVYLLIAAVSYSSLDPGLFQAGIWISLLGFAAWLLVLHRARAPLRYPRLLLAMGLYLLLRLALAAQAPIPILSLETVLRELVLLLGFLFIFSSLDLIWTPASWENALINLALVFMALELALAYFWHRNWVAVSGSLFPLPPVGYRSPGIFLGHPNVLAGFLNLVLPIMVVRWITERDRPRRMLWTLGLLLFVPTLYFTSSRTGLMAGIAGALTTLALVFGPRALVGRAPSRQAPLWKRVEGKYLFAAALLLLFLAGFAALFLIHSQRVASHAPTLISARAEIWGPALAIIAQRPLLGHGPASFSILFARETQIPPGFATSHAHNLLLQTAAETGLVGTALVSWMILWAARSFLRAWRAAAPQARLRLASYAGAGVALLAHHTLDYLFESPLYALSALSLLALALRQAPQSEQAPLRGRPAALGLAIAVILPLAGLSYTMAGAGQYWQGLRAGRAGDWPTAARRICLAAQQRPQISLYAFQCSLAQAQLYQQEGDPSALHAALAGQRQALQRDPHWPIHWANLAALEWQEGEFEAALGHMRQALDMAPANATVARALARMEQAMDDPSAAAAANLQALGADPWMQFSLNFGASEPEREALRQLAKQEEELLARFPALEGWQALQAGRWEAARQALSTTLQRDAGDTLARAGLALALQALGQEQEARTQAQIAAFLDPSSPLVLHAAGSVARQQGREGEAARLFLRAFDQVEGQSYSASYYYRTYNRFFLTSDLVPMLPRGNLTASMAQDFGWLAERLEQNGHGEQAGMIRARIRVEKEGLQR